MRKQHISASLTFLKDTFAIILAAEHPNLNLLGLSTVHGNSSLQNVTINSHSVLKAIGKTEIPVYAGAAKPFMRPAVHAPDIHGESGIDGTNLLPKVEVPEYSTKENAVLAMRNALMATPPNTAALVATGTLTNVALLFATFPEVAKHIKVFSIMGGAFGNRPDSRGNVTKTAEFNIFCDPEAAQSGTSISSFLALHWVNPNIRSSFLYSGVERKDNFDPPGYYPYLLCWRRYPEEAS